MSGVGRKWELNGAITGPNAAYFIGVHSDDQPLCYVRRGQRCIAYVPLAEEGSHDDAILIASAPEQQAKIDALAAALGEMLALAEFEGEHTDAEWDEYDRRLAFALPAARAALRAIGRIP